MDQQLRFHLQHLVLQLDQLVLCCLLVQVVQAIQLLQSLQEYLLVQLVLVGQGVLQDQGLLLFQLVLSHQAVHVVQQVLQDQENLDLLDYQLLQQDLFVLVLHEGLADRLILDLLVLHVLLVHQQVLLVQKVQQVPGLQ